MVNGKTENILFNSIKLNLACETSHSITEILGGEGGIDSNFQWNPAFEKRVHIKLGFNAIKKMWFIWLIIKKLWSKFQIDSVEDICWQCNIYDYRGKIAIIYQK